MRRLVRLGGILVAGAGALALYERYAGEDPLADTLFDLRLRRRTLEELDRFCATNPRRSDLIVSLTTIPTRIDRMAPTLKSLLWQAVSPAAIRLNLPRVSKREGVAYGLPAWLAGLHSVTIVRTEDYGPSTKVIPSLLTLPPDQRILVVDDDRIYHRHLVEQMTRWSDDHPGVAVAASGWDAPSNMTDRPTTLYATLAGQPPAPIKCTRVNRVREIDVMQGLSGYVVTPSFFDLPRVIDYSRAPHAAFFVDDVWISAHCRVPKVIPHGRRTNFPSIFDGRFYKRSGVARINRGSGTNESRNNTIMLRYFQDRWKVSRSSGTIRRRADLQVGPSSRA